MPLINITSINCSLFVQILHTLTPSLNLLRGHLPSTDDVLTIEEAQNILAQSKVKEGELLYFRHWDTYHLGLVKRKLLMLTITNTRGKIQLNIDAYIAKYKQLGYFAIHLSLQVATLATFAYSASSLLALDLVKELFIHHQFDKNMRTEDDTFWPFLVGDFYVSRSSIGKGAFGAVHLAHDNKGKVVVVKSIPAKDHLTKTSAQMEADALHKLGLFHFVQETSKHNTVHIVRDFVSGVEPPETMRFEEAVRAVLSLSTELFRYHEKNVPHTDIRLCNILHDPYTHCYTLIDGGGPINMSAPFAAPELPNIKPDANILLHMFRADIYSLGIFVGHCFGFSGHETKTSDPRLEPIYAFYKKMTHADPARRPSDLQEIMHFFSGIYHTLPLELPLAVSPHSQPSYLVLRETITYLQTQLATLPESKEEGSLVSIEPLDMGCPADYFKIQRRCYGRPPEELDADSFAPKMHFILTIILQLKYDGTITLFHMTPDKNRIPLANYYSFQQNRNGSISLIRGEEINKDHKKRIIETSLKNVAIEFHRQSEKEKRAGARLGYRKSCT